MAIRLAIGAARRRLVRQLLTESVLLAGIGALVGVAFARWGSAAARGSAVARTGPRVARPRASTAECSAFTLIVAVATGILFGLAPAWRATRIDPQAALKANGRGIAEGHTRFSIGKALVVGQIALSLVLVIGAGLLLGSFRKLTTLDPGFQRDGVLIVSVNLRHAGYSADALRRLCTATCWRGFARLPGVVAQPARQLTPISGSGVERLHQSRRLRRRRAPEDNLVYFNEVTDGFFATMGTPLLVGRDFDDRDRPTSQPVAIVNEAMARKFFSGASPLGKALSARRCTTASAPPIEIVGVVKDAKYRELREEILPTIVPRR